MMAMARVLCIENNAPKMKAMQGKENPTQLHATTFYNLYQIGGSRVRECSHHFSKVGGGQSEESLRDQKLKYLCPPLTQ